MCIVLLRYYQVFDHSKTFSCKSMLSVSNSSGSTKRKLRCKLDQHISNIMTDFGNLINFPLPPAISAHLRMVSLQESRHYQELPSIIKCLPSMLKNREKCEEESFATVSNR